MTWRLPYAKIVSIPPDILKRVSQDTIIIILIFYSLFTAIRNMNWKNEVIFRAGMVQEYPDNAEAHSALARSLRKAGLLDRAIAEYKIALNLDPHYAKDYNALGVCYYEKGMYEEAIENFKRALELNPNLMSAYANLGSAFGDKGLYREAIGCF